MIKNYYCKDWILKELRRESDLDSVVNYIAEGYNYIACDTETTGLHIIQDKAFCLTFALVNYYEKIGRAYVVDLRRVPEESIHRLENILMSGKCLVFWNAKFDLHMLYNIGMTRLKDYENITDAMIYARIANDAITPDKGGVSLQLKEYSTKMLDSEAKTYERAVSMAKRELIIRQNNLLKIQGIKIGQIRDFLSDKINTINELPYNVQEILNSNKYNQNNYENVSWETLSKYAAFDSIFTIENYIRDYKVVEEREQLEIAKKEETLIPILWQMERYGFKLNSFYLHQAKVEMKNYIIEQRKKLEALVGQPLKVGQHELIKSIFREKYGVTLDKSDEDALKQITQPDAKEVAEIILELRTLEKWFSTYICKWEENAQTSDRIYTSFNQCGAVSGRFSCDFQQFPKEPVYKKDGTLLYSPRRIVMVSGDEYDQLCLIDYAAEELRIQAIYTHLIGEPDLNLSRAYIPMNCFQKPDGWYLKESPQTKWHPTDLHTLTTLTAFPELTIESPDFKHYRKLGKCTNFA